MRKQVNARQIYLPALDSVRNSREEIVYAHQKLCDVLVHEGATVVITLNQLTDSVALLSLVWQEKTYQWLMQLFKMGAIKLSRFGSCPSAASFVKGKLAKLLPKPTEETGNNLNSRREEKQDAFIFSALPIRTGGNTYDTQLIQAMYQSLEACDPSYLRELLTQRAEGKPLDNTAEFLLRYVKMLLSMSMAELAANPPKKGKWRKQEDYLQLIYQMEREEAEGLCQLAGLTLSQFQQAQQVLETLCRRMQFNQRDLNSRSEWYRCLKEEADRGTIPRDTLVLVEGIVDYCYNMSMENSIFAVSPFYEPGNVRMQLEQAFQQLGQYISPETNHGHQFLQGDGETVWPENLPTPKLKRVVRLLKTTNVRRRTYSGTPMGMDRKAYRVAWGVQIFLAWFKHVAQIVACMVLFVFIEMWVNRAQDELDWFTWLNISVFAGIVKLLLFCFVETIILKSLEKFLGVDDLDGLYLMVALVLVFVDACTLPLQGCWYFYNEKQMKYIL